MCLRNDSPEQLKEIRAKGHVLQKGYKALAKKENHRNGNTVWKSIIYPLKWKKGWNRARTIFYIPRFRKKAAKDNANIYSAFHICLNATEAKAWVAYWDEKVVEVWFYCDEVLAVEAATNIATNIAVNRVLVKEFPED